MQYLSRANATKWVRAFNRPEPYDFGSQSWRFEPVRVQMAADKQVVYYLSRHLKRKSKFVSQLLASFEVQIAENQCLDGIQNALDSILARLNVNA